MTWSASAGADPPAGKQARRQAPPPAPTIPAKIDCRALVQDGFTSNATVPDFQDIPEAPTRIQSATIVAATATQPEYCDVRGYVQSQIKFQLKLPTTTWQGRYLQFGCGGFCGTITPTTFPACRTELGGDFAIASTNDGHDAAGTDALWAGQTEQPRIDFGYRAVHVVAVAAKAIQAAYYGRAPIKSYFQGCSDGGREGLMEAQRYPDDFDGIVAGAPALQMEFSPLFLANVIQANTGADGNPILTLDKLAPLHAAVVEACDGNDGVTGNDLIGDPRDCRSTRRSIRCPGADGPTCLTSAQVSVVRTIYAGARDRSGRRLDPRMTPRGSELTWAGWWVPAPPPPTAPAGHSPGLGRDRLRRERGALAQLPARRGQAAQPRRALAARLRPDGPAGQVLRRGQPEPRSLPAARRQAAHLPGPGRRAGAAERDDRLLQRGARDDGRPAPDRPLRAALPRQRHEPLLGRPDAEHLGPRAADGPLGRERRGARLDHGRPPDRAEVRRRCAATTTSSGPGTT